MKTERYTEGMKMNDANLNHLESVSVYNHNYYQGLDGDLIFGDSDDDNTTEWYLIDGKDSAYLGYSYCSEGDLLHKQPNT